MPDSQNDSKNEPPMSPKTIMMGSLPDEPTRIPTTDTTIQAGKETFQELVQEKGQTKDIEETETIADLIKEYNSMVSPRLDGDDSPSKAQGRAWEKTESDNAREELQQYLADLKTKEDFVVFPDNYDEVVTLMTEKDVSILLYA